MSTPSGGKMVTFSSAIEVPSNSSTSLYSERSSLKRKIALPSPLEYPIVPPKNDPLRFRDLPHGICFEGDGYGVVTRKGTKMFMEDSHRIEPCFDGSSNKSFFGVYDGHGGCRAAKFSATSLHENVLEMIKNCKEKEEKVEAIKAAFLKTDRDFLEKDFKCGACCVTVLIQDQEMFVSNLGDCRAVLCRQGGVAEALTNDHKAGREDERKRIQNQGGYVGYHKRAWRVDGTLAVSRSIGDVDLKQWVIAVPDTTILQLEEDMEFLVLASDGLWDMVANQEAVDTVLNVLAQRKTHGESVDKSLIQGIVDLNSSPFVKQQQEELLPVQSPKSAKSSENESPHREMASPASESGKIMAACKELVDLAVSRGTKDDITVVIVDLNHYKC